jgi:hypothetical protein
MSEDTMNISSLQAEKHHFSSDDKIRWWGYGEWVEEVDEVKFNYKGMECLVRRMAEHENCSHDDRRFGGYLCGYVAVPFGHPYYQKRYEDMDIECHGGLTFGECADSHWIGFDCSHSMDYSPSLEYLKKTATWMKDFRDREEELKKKFNLQHNPIFNKSYKNIEYCINECKSIADQLIEAAKK